MSELTELVEPLKRTVAVPGTFADVFPNTSDDDLASTLLDAFAEAQLDGFYPAVDITDDGVTTPDLTRAETALVVMYASGRILEMEILNRKSHVRYEAGPTVFEQDQGVSLLTEALKGIRDRKRDLLDQARRGLMYDGFTMADLAFIKATTSYGDGLSYSSAFG